MQFLIFITTLFSVISCSKDNLKSYNVQDIQDFIYPHIPVKAIEREGFNAPPLVPVSQVEIMHLQTMAKWASIASCSQTQLQQWTCGYCRDLKDIKFINYFYHSSTDDAGFLAVNNSTGDYYLVFRATVGIINWFYNLQIDMRSMEWPSIAPGVRVHAGFWSSYSSLQADVRATIQGLKIPSNKKLHIVGHSLGAAMACLAAMDLATAGIVPRPQIHITTFGCPRVGNSKWASIFDVMFPPFFPLENSLQPIGHVRVVYQRDVVSHLPPRDLPLNDYVHTMQEWWWPAHLLKKNDTSTTQPVKCSQLTGEDPRCSDQLDFLTVWDHFHFLDVIFGCGADKFTPSAGGNRN